MKTLRRFAPVTFLSLVLCLGAAGGQTAAASQFTPSAGQTSLTLQTTTPLLPAYWADYFLGSRTRMVQGAFLAIALGIFILMWGKRY